MLQGASKGIVWRCMSLSNTHRCPAGSPSRANAIGQSIPAATRIAPGAHQDDIKIRIIPSDPYRSGSYGQTGDFEVDNTTPPSVTVTNPGSPKTANGTIDYRLYDADSEVCSTVVEG